jgi:hypothetical protein
MEQREKTQIFVRENIGKVRSKASNNLFFENEIVPEYITTRIAAGLLGVSENALRIKVCRGQVPVHKLGRSLRFRVSEIARLFKPRE